MSWPWPRPVMLLIWLFCVANSTARSANWLTFGRRCRCGPHRRLCQQWLQTKQRPIQRPREPRSELYGVRYVWHELHGVRTQQHFSAGVVCPPRFFHFLPLNGLQALSTGTGLCGLCSQCICPFSRLLGRGELGRWLAGRRVFCL